MQISTPYMTHVAAGLVGSASAVIVYLFARAPAAERPQLGGRGIMRRRVLARGGIFRVIEPAVRFLAGRMKALPIDNWRAGIAGRLSAAGDWLGVTPDEFLALSVISSLSMVGVGLVLSTMIHVGGLLYLLAAVVGMLIPGIEVDGARGRRSKQINRTLPGAIDLAALCMGAGLDFPGALQQVVDNAPKRNSELVDEIRRILRALRLGRTRRSALEGFAERVPTESVKDFVGAVIQAEEKGTPLAEVLRIQAGVLRMRRTVMAEEAAAKAGVMLLLPLLLVFACVFMLLLGPFIVDFVGSGM